jgi:hypothetical protein
MNLGSRQFVFLLLLCLTFVSCESEYSQVVKRELKSGVIHEDLIFGMKMGQTLKDFYDRCWELNKQKLVSEGSGNRFAKHIMVLDSIAQNPERVELLFYGIFDEEKIMHGMHMKLSYLKWALWNEDYHAEPLMDNLQKKYIKDYPGNPFIEIDIDATKKAFVKVDGNRQILMFPLSNKDVTVKIQDLRQPKSTTE